MQHRLILFTGSGPGAGKSTLSRLLFEQFLTQDIPAHWLHEDDVVEVFRQFILEIDSSEPTIDGLLQASSALVKHCSNDAATWIIDSHLPGFYYLYGRYPDAQIKVFSTELYSVLKPLQPLVIYLRSDVQIALMRGMQQRGGQWLKNITRYMNGWQLPFYGSSPKPVRTVSDVIEFFSRADGLSVSLLAEWPNFLMLDTTDTPADNILASILSQLQFKQQNVDRRVPLEELKRYQGVYVLYAGEQMPQSLKVSVVGDELFVNTYWPNGARLIPEDRATFHLEGSNRHIKFNLLTDGQPSGLTYYYGDVISTYKKES